MAWIAPQAVGIGSFSIGPESRVLRAAIIDGLPHRSIVESMSIEPVSSPWHDFPLFEFEGLGGNPGYCFLRVTVRPDNSAVFLCAQLVGYRGTSVANGIETIFQAAVKRMNDDGLFVGGQVMTPRRVLRKSRWVELYPRGTDIVQEDSYALVAFDKFMDPVWNHVTLDRAASDCFVDRNFLIVDRERLEYK